MAFTKQNEFSKTLLLVFIAIPLIVSTNIDCMGKAFHCVNSTHFLICVDFGNGVSTTVEDFVIPCPYSTECHHSNIFECEFPPATPVPVPPTVALPVEQKSTTEQWTEVFVSTNAPLMVYEETKINETISTESPSTSIDKIETTATNLDTTTESINIENIYSKTGKTNDLNTNFDLVSTQSLPDFKATSQANDNFNSLPNTTEVYFSANLTDNESFTTNTVISSTYIDVLTTEKIITDTQGTTQITDNNSENYLYVTEAYSTVDEIRNNKGANLPSEDIIQSTTVVTIKQFGDDSTGAYDTGFFNTDTEQNTTPSTIDYNNAGENYTENVTAKEDLSVTQNTTPELTPVAESHVTSSTGKSNLTRRNETESVIDTLKTTDNTVVSDNNSVTSSIFINETDTILLTPSLGIENSTSAITLIISIPILSTTESIVIATNNSDHNYFGINNTDGQVSEPNTTTDISNNDTTEITAEATIVNETKIYIMEDANSISKNTNPTPLNENQTLNNTTESNKFLTTVSTPAEIDLNNIITVESNNQLNTNKVNNKNNGNSTIASVIPINLNSTSTTPITGDSIVSTTQYNEQLNIEFSERTEQSLTMGTATLIYEPTSDASATSTTLATTVTSSINNEDSVAQTITESIIIDTTIKSESYSNTNVLLKSTTTPQYFSTNEKVASVSNVSEYLATTPDMQKDSQQTEINNQTLAVQDVTESNLGVHTSNSNNPLIDTLFNSTISPLPNNVIDNTTDDMFNGQRPSDTIATIVYELSTSNSHFDTGSSDTQTFPSSTHNDTVDVVDTTFERGTTESFILGELPQPTTSQIANLPDNINITGQTTSAIESITKQTPNDPDVIKTNNHSTTVIPEKNNNMITLSVSTESIKTTHGLESIENSISTRPEGSTITLTLNSEISPPIVDTVTSAVLPNSSALNIATTENSATYSVFENGEVLVITTDNYNAVESATNLHADDASTLTNNEITAEKPEFSSNTATNITDQSILSGGSTDIGSTSSNNWSIMDITTAATNLFATDVNQNIKAFLPNINSTASHDSKSTDNYNTVSMIKNVTGAPDVPVEITDSVTSFIPTIQQEVSYTTDPDTGISKTNNALEPNTTTKNITKQDSTTENLEIGTSTSSGFAIKDLNNVPFSNTVTVPTIPSITESNQNSGFTNLPTEYGTAVNQELSGSTNSDTNDNLSNVPVDSTVSGAANSPGEEIKQNCGSALPKLDSTVNQEISGSISNGDDINNTNNVSLTNINSEVTDQSLAETNLNNTSENSSALIQEINFTPGEQITDSPIEENNIKNIYTTQTVNSPTSADVTTINPNNIAVAGPSKNITNSEHIHNSIENQGESTHIFTTTDNIHSMNTPVSPVTASSLDKVTRKNNLEQHTTENFISLGQSEPSQTLTQLQSSITTGSTNPTANQGASSHIVTTTESSINVPVTQSNLDLIVNKGTTKDNLEQHTTEHVISLGQTEPSQSLTQLQSSITTGSTNPTANQEASSHIVTTIENSINVPVTQSNLYLIVNKGTTKDNLEQHTTETVISLGQSELRQTLTQLHGSATTESTILTNIQKMTIPTTDNYDVKTVTNNVNQVNIGETVLTVPYKPAPSMNQARSSTLTSITVMPAVASIATKTTEIDKTTGKLLTAKIPYTTSSPVPQTSTQTSTKENVDHLLTSKSIPVTSATATHALQPTVTEKHYSDKPSITNTPASNVSNEKLSTTIELTTTKIDLTPSHTTARNMATTLAQTTETTVSKQTSQPSDNINVQQKESSAVEQFDCRFKNRGRYSDTHDCRKFYVCSGHTQPIINLCPVNTVFSEIRGQCTRNLSHCVRENQFICAASGRYADFFKQNVYYICVKNNHDHYVRFKFQCQNGYRLDKSSVKCLQYSERMSVSKSTDSNASESAPEKQSKEKTNETKNRDKEFRCRKEGKFADPDNCRKYYVCSENRKSQIRRKKKKCDSDEVFHKDKKKCVDAESYECS